MSPRSDLFVDVETADQSYTSASGKANKKFRTREKVESPDPSPFIRYSRSLNLPYAFANEETVGERSNREPSSIGLEPHDANNAYQPFEMQREETKNESTAIVLLAKAFPVP